MPAPLLIGSSEPFSGKSALALGLARLLLNQGVRLRFGKPLASMPAADGPLIDPDTRFIGSFLGLAEEQLIPSLHSLDPEAAHRRLLMGDLEAGEALAALRQALRGHADDEALVMLEGAGSLSEGLLFGLSLPQVAHGLGAEVVLVHPWKDSRSVDPLLEVRRQLGDRLAGVVLNAVEPEAVPALRADVRPALERLGLPVLGIMPRSPLLRSVTVEELGRRLQARVLCSADRLDLLVETLSIGAMNVNSAMEFFRRRRNMAVVTGADRTDIQLAALEASTQCLILTGVGEPLPQLISRAEELEVPVLKVEHDTLTTVEVIEAAIGHVRLQEAVKATYAVRLVEESCGFEPLYARLRLPVPA
jgi:BioD-like phosphotransacetylase family protein